MLTSATLTIRLDPEVKQRLGKIAKHDHSTQALLAAEAVEAYVKNREWWEDKITQARASGYAEDAEVSAFFGKWAES